MGFYATLARKVLRVFLSDDILNLAKEHVFLAFHLTQYSVVLLTYDVLRSYLTFTITYSSP